MEPVWGTTRTTSDRELVLAFQAGDRVAYDEMYRRYHPRVYSVCYRILNSSQDAEEASQDTFLRAYQALPRFNGNFRLGAWLARIAANASVDQLRSKARAPLVGLPTEEPEGTAELDPEEVVTGGDPRLEIALGDIKPLHARALALRNVEGLSHQEIAGTLSMSPQQVKALLHRARLSLRRAWDRAEGWVLAPLFGFRSFFNDRSDAQSSSSLMGAAPALTPIIAERVATTALAVAVVLTGFSGPTGMPSNGSNLDGHNGGFGWGTGSSSPVLKPKAASSEDATGVKKTLVASDPVADLTREIDVVLSGHDHFNNKPEKHPRSDDDDPSAGAASTAHKLVRKVKDLLPAPIGDSDLRL